MPGSSNVTGYCPNQADGKPAGPPSALERRPRRLRERSKPPSRLPSVQLGQTHRLAKPPARLEGVAVFPVGGRDVRTGEQQPLAVAAPVLGIILQETLRDLLVVRVVAEARRHQCETLYQQSAILTAVEVGLGPGHRRGRVECGECGLQTFDDLAAAHPVGAARRADRSRFEPAAASLV